MAGRVRNLRRLALAEGVSFLLLLGVAMPLRRWAGMPLAVTVAGWAHGLLFIAVCAALWRLRAGGWSRERVAIVVCAALLPFGTFLLDPRMRDWEREAAAGRPAPAAVEG